MATGMWIFCLYYYYYVHVYGPPDMANGSMQIQMNIKVYPNGSLLIREVHANDDYSAVTEMYMQLDQWNILYS